jgi:hypothetical protein
MYLRGACAGVSSENQAKAVNQLVTFGCHGVCYYDGSFPVYVRMLRSL